MNALAKMIKTSFLGILIMVCGILYSQNCDGVLGLKLFSDDFGSGAGPGPPLPVGTTTYTYGSIGGGNYIVPNYTGVNGSLWHKGPDHTPGDEDGYCLLFDADWTPGLFYRRLFEDLCANTRYSFSCYVTNLVVPSACGGVSIEPNLKFSLIDPATMMEIGSISTGDIPTTDTMTWKQYSITFRTNQSQDDILIEVTNNTSGGCGNDLAIDDFSFNICNPTSEQKFDLCLLPDQMIQVGNDIYTESGFYETEIDLPGSCNDSIVYTTLTETEFMDSTIFITICEGQVVTIDGEDYSGNGVVQDTVEEFGNCPRIFTYIIDENEALISNEQLSFCSGDSVLIAGIWVYNEGVYQDTITTDLGCDSIVFKVLTEIIVNDTTVFVSLCEDETITIDGQEYGGNTTIVDTSFVGSCPELITFILEENETSVSDELRNICSGDSTLISGEWVFQEGVYQDTMVSDAGCDSIVFVTIAEVETNDSVEFISLCPGETITINGVMYSGNIIVVDTTFINACPETTTFVISEEEIPPTFENISICERDSIMISGEWVSEEGVYQDTLVTSLGCDSIVINLVEIEALQIIDEHYLFCENESIFLDGEEYSEETVFLDTIDIPDECPRIVRNILEAIPPPISELNGSICEGDSLFIGGQWVFQAGVYVDTINSMKICDSIIIFNLSTYEFDLNLNVSTITISPGDTIQLFASTNSGSDAEYEWSPSQYFSCDDCEDPIFSPTQSGEYSVVAYDPLSGCSDLFIFSVILDPCDQSHFPNIFSPNGDGINDYFYPHLSFCIVEVLTFQVFDRWGSQVHIQNNIPIDAPAWDGSFQDTEASMGVYAYMLEALFFDGSTKLFKGDVTVVR